MEIVEKDFDKKERERLALTKVYNCETLKGLDEALEEYILIDENWISIFYDLDNDLIEDYFIEKIEQDNNDFISKMHLLMPSYLIKIFEGILTKNPSNKVINTIKSHIIDRLFEDALTNFLNFLGDKDLFSNSDISMDKFVKKIFCFLTNDSKCLYALENVFDELLSCQRLKICNISYVGSGCFSYVYKVGEYVLKVSEDRHNFEKIPYHRRILQPIVRSVIGKNYYNEERFFLEIQNIVDVNWKKGLNDAEIFEELYKIYKEIRDAGLIWTDIRAENVGRLIKPNTVNYINPVTKKELVVDDASIGIEERKEDDSLVSGELVVLDTDHIFKYNPKEKRVGLICAPFEEKYQKEKGTLDNEIG